MSDTDIGDFEASIALAWAVACDLDDGGYDEITVCWEAIEQAAELLGVDIADIRADVEFGWAGVPEVSA